VWVATELGRTRLFTGFPWVLLGYSQTDVLPVAQFASIFGVYGVSALVASVSAGVAVWLVAPVRRARSAYVPLALALAAVASLALWGSQRIRSGALTAEGDVVRVGLIQGNVSLEEKWDTRRAPQTFRNYLTMSREAIAQGASFIIWPESATPFVFADNLGGAEEVRRLARSANAAVLLGSDQVERGGPDNRWYNSAYLVGPDGNTQAVYQKMHLVPFGEYVPLKPLFFFASRLVEAVSDFSPGTAAVLLPVGSHHASTAICYEVVYPDLVRQFVAGGSQLLTTITNDAWFGPTSAPYQHFAQASMRAIENGRYLVRAANTGISGIVDPYGRVLDRSGLFEPAVIVGDVRFLTATTFYTRTGDLFAYLCTAATLAMLAAGWRRYRIPTHDRGH
jgi:apolipoprotein N-acyltransferase